MTLAGASLQAAPAEPFPAIFPLATLLPGYGGDGSAGFVLRGIDEGDRSGHSIEPAGDVNGDGIGDLIIGADRADPHGKSYAGEAYVVFGTPKGFPAAFELSGLLAANGGDGTAGFVLYGSQPYDHAGFAASAAGDVNGDGVGDLVIGADRASPGGRHYAGECYVVFGRSAKDGAFPAELELATLFPENGGDGSAGFILTGVDAGDFVGDSLTAAGDLNGDGIDDIALGATYASHGGRRYAGESYVVFGRDTSRSGLFPAVFELAGLTPAGGGDGSAGFVVHGIDRDDLAGFALKAGGDVNGDGLDDLVIGAVGADPNGQESAGESYVVFGRNTAQAGNFPPVFPLGSLKPAGGGDGSTGFVLHGIRAYDRAFSVNGAGDVNGDGHDDLVIGAWGTDVRGREDTGRTYVVFGRDAAQAGNFPAVFPLADLLPARGGDGTTGFALNGIEAGDRTAQLGATSTAGDVNGDGHDDLLIGATLADLGGRVDAGRSYIVFGRDSAQSGNFPAEFGLASLMPGAGGDGSAGFVLNGIDAYDYSGRWVSNAGDINGDGVDDIVIGSRGADPGGRDYAGESYVVFGRATARHGAPAGKAASGD